MATTSLYTSLGAVLIFAQQGLGYQVCQDTTYFKYYCEDGYHCCNDNSECCKDGLGVGTWAGIIIGIILFKIVLICLCVRACKRRREAVLVVQRQPIMKAPSAPPSYSSLGNQPNQPTSGATGTYQGPKPTPAGPPPPYTAQ